MCILYIYYPEALLFHKLNNVYILENPKFQAPPKIYIYMCVMCMYNILSTPSLKLTKKKELIRVSYRFESFWFRFSFFFVFFSDKMQISWFYLQPFFFFLPPFLANKRISFAILTIYFFIMHVRFSNFQVAPLKFLLFFWK